MVSAYYATVCCSYIEAACSGQIDMAETRDNGHVYDKLLKKKMLLLNDAMMKRCIPYILMWCCVFCSFLVSFASFLPRLQLLYAST